MWWWRFRRDGFPKRIGTLLRTGRRRYGRAPGPVVVELLMESPSVTGHHPLSLELTSSSRSWRERLADEDTSGLWMIAFICPVAGAIALLPANLLFMTSAAFFGGAALFTLAKRVLGKKERLFFAVVDESDEVLVSLRILEGKGALRTRVRDVRVGTRPLVGGDVEQVIELVPHEGAPVAISPREHGITIDASTAERVVDALRVALALQHPELASLAPTDDPLRALTSPPRALVEPPRCPHRRDTLVREPGPLDLERCPVCRGALVPSHKAHELVESRLQLSKADLDEIAASFGGPGFPCVACGARMRPLRLRGVTVEMCRGCGALWLDDGEERAFYALFGAPDDASA